MSADWLLTGKECSPKQTESEKPQEEESEAKEGARTYIRAVMQLAEKLPEDELKRLEGDIKDRLMLIDLRGKRGSN